MGRGTGAAIFNKLFESRVMYSIYTTKNWQECANKLGLVADEKGDIEIVLTTVLESDNQRNSDLHTVPRF